MIDRTRDVMRGFTLAALTCALAGCSDSDSVEADKPKPSDPVEVAAEELGVKVPGCESGGFVAASATLTLTLDANAAVISAPGGKINVNGYVCQGTVGGVANTQLTTANVKKIVMNGSDADNKVIFDLLPGTFGTTIFGAQGGVTVDFTQATDPTMPGDDTFMIRGGVNAETFKLGKRTAMNEIYVEVTNDKVADILVKHIANHDLTLTASMGAGADTVIGNPVAADIMTFGTGAVTIEKMAYGFTAYGGAGDDKLTGGDGADTFYGGDNADTFKTASVADGADIYVGDSGNDTVEYLNRTDPVFADIGPARVAILGTENLAQAVADLDGETLEVNIDGAGAVEVTFATPADPADVADQINTAVMGDPVAFVTAMNQLLIMSSTSDANSAVSIVDGTGLALLGFTMGDEAVPDMDTGRIADADDGYVGEGDDIRPTTENITGGMGDDTLIGDSAKNTIKGGNGNDILMGGGNTTCTTTADGDTLQGEAGNDTFWMPIQNNCAALTGGTGDNVANFSGRSATVLISNNGVANDGIDGEKVNVAADILKLIGGFGDDTITGGMGNDWIIGGLGGDTMSGGAGIDIVDYTERTEDIDASPCFTATAGACTPAKNDGATGEMDEIHLVEHIKGGEGVDTFDATGATVDITFEGNDGNDELTGGGGNDQLWGDAGDDTVIGGAGDDNIDGGADADEIQGGTGDGDICVTDGDDTPAAIECEL